MNIKHLSIVTSVYCNGCK